MSILIISQDGKRHMLSVTQTIAHDLIEERPRTVADIADEMGKDRDDRAARRRILRACRTLVRLGLVDEKESKRYDSQPMQGANSAMFGGAGACIRRFWVFSSKKGA